MPTFAVLVDAAGRAHTADCHSDKLQQRNKLRVRRFPRPAENKDLYPWAGFALGLPPNRSGFTSRPVRRREEHREPTRSYDRGYIDQKNCSSFTHSDMLDCVRIFEPENRSRSVNLS